MSTTTTTTTAIQEIKAKTLRGSAVGALEVAHRCVSAFPPNAYFHALVRCLFVKDANEFRPAVYHAAVAGHVDVVRFYLSLMVLSRAGQPAHSTALTTFAETHQNSKLSPLTIADFFELFGFPAGFSKQEFLDCITAAKTIYRPLFNENKHTLYDLAKLCTDMLRESSASSDYLQPISKWHYDITRQWKSKEQPGTHTPFWGLCAITPYMPGPVKVAKVFPWLGRTTGKPRYHGWHRKTNWKCDIDFPEDSIYDYDSTDSEWCEKEEDFADGSTREEENSNKGAPAAAQLPPITWTDDRFEKSNNSDSESMDNDWELLSTGDSDIVSLASTVDFSYKDVVIIGATDLAIRCRPTLATKYSWKERRPRPTLREDNTSTMFDADFVRQGVKGMRGSRQRILKGKHKRLKRLQQQKEGMDAFLATAFQGTRHTTRVVCL
jgi:hypothetical protein